MHWTAIFISTLRFTAMLIASLYLYCATIAAVLSYLHRKKHKKA